jgi:type I restriction enzyme S subunit
MSKFPKDWEIRELREVALVQTGLAKGKNSIKDPVTLPYLRVANVQDGYLDLTHLKTIQVAKAEIARYSLNLKDVVLTEGGDLDKLGRGCVWQGQIEPCLHQNHIFAVRTLTDTLRPEFLALLTSSPYGRLYFLSCAKQTTNLASINSTQLKEFPVLLPPIAEQDRLIQIFNSWDTGIEQTENLIKAKIKRKRGLMQQLLTGKKRLQEFTGQEWKQVHLGDIFRERCETFAEYARKLREAEQAGDEGCGTVSLGLLSITARDGVVYRDTLDKRDTSNEDKSKYLHICPGDIGYNTMRMWQGVSGLSELEGIVSPAYTICIPTDEIDGKFASYLFKYLPLVHLFWRYSQGLVDDTLSLKFHHFAQIKTLLPPIEEQRRIAAILGCCDKEIKLLKQQLDALKRQKRGLMQKLLTGQIRVKVDNIEAAAIEAS